MNMEEKVKELEAKKAKIREGGNPEEIKKRRERGMLSARERLARLLDPGSFVELDILVEHHSTVFGMDRRKIPADGVITGHGKIDGRLVFVFSQDYSALAGTYGEYHSRKIFKIMDLALEVGAPVIGLNESGGARLHEMREVTESFGRLFYRNTLLSGVVPQISALFGVCAGGQTYAPGLTDFILITKDTYMFIAGPAFVRTQTGEKVSLEELGGAKMHSRVSGVADLVTETEEECLDKVRELLSYLPSNNRGSPPFLDTGDDPERTDEELLHVVPVEANKPFDMHQVIWRVVDNGRFFESKPNYARNIITGFARLGGRSVGIVASQCLALAGAIDVNASEKAARFIRFCDAFNIPIVYLLDTPMYMIGKEQEQRGIIFRGAKLLHATSEATVPKITVVIRKAYAGSYLAMGSKYLGADQVYAWPGAEFFMGADTAASVIFRSEVEKAENPEELRQRRVKEYYDTFVSPYVAASWQHIDDIIDPRQTRPVLIRALEMTANKREDRPWRKHSNIPL